MEKKILDWERNVRIVLRSECQHDGLETPISIVTPTSSDEEKVMHMTIEDRLVIITCLMLLAMELRLQKHVCS